MIDMVTSTRLPLSFTFISLLFIAYSLHISESHGVGPKFQLIHRHHRRGGASSSSLERLRRLVHSDTVRLRGISRKVRRRMQENDGYEPACNNGSSGGGGGGGGASGELPIRSAADEGAGQYLVKFRVGSPAQKVVLIADTGSDLTWTNCEYRCRGGRCGAADSDRRRRRVFRADRSSSFRTVPCSSTACKVDLANLFSLSSCPSPLDPCAYDYRSHSLSLSLSCTCCSFIICQVKLGHKDGIELNLLG